MIEIYAVSYNGQPSAASMRGAFGPEGGTVGRSPDNRLPLPDPARHVSRIQAKVRWDGRRYWIANTSEANPLFLNDEEIESGKERPLVAGDELRVGLYVLRVREPVGPTVDYRPAGGSAGTEQTLGAGAAPPPGSPPPAAASIDGLLGHAGAAANPFADLLGSSAPLASAPAVRMDPLGALAGHSALSGGGFAGSADPLGGLGQPARPAPAAAPPQRPSAGADPFAGLINAPPAAPVPAATATSSDPFAALARPSADPFADLLGTAGSSVGSAPMPARPAGPAATHIPDDFNPFAMPATPARNTADPLRDLADDGIDLASLSGEKRVSLVDFDPSAKIDPRDTLRGGTPSLVDSQHAADPMKLFGGPEDRLVAGNAAAPGGRLPMRDDFAELGANFTPPRALADPRAPGAGSAPAPATAGPARAPPPAARPVAPIAPDVRPPAPPGSPGRPAALPASASIDLAGLAASAPTSPIPANSMPGAPVPAMGGPARPAPGGGGGLSGAAPADLLAAFLEGAHAQAMNLPSGLTPELMRTMGRLVYHAVAGAMTLISARQITKREMGAEVTMIVPRGNNPLKFLPTPEAALMQILGPKMPGFMSSVDAMEDAFDDLRAHEVGVIAGTRAALGEVLRRFDPKVLEARLGTGGLIDNLVPATRRSKLWAAFEAQFNEVYREAEEDFNKLFGEAFIVAYQAEVARHRSPPR